MIFSIIFFFFTPYNSINISNNIRALTFSHCTLFLAFFLFFSALLEKMLTFLFGAFFLRFLNRHCLLENLCVRFQIEAAYRRYPTIHYTHVYVRTQHLNWLMSFFLFHNCCHTKNDFFCILFSILVFFSSAFFPFIQIRKKRKKGFDV